MNSAIGQILFLVGGSWVLATVVKATLVLALALGVNVLARRKRAAFRHAVLAGTFAVLLALPVVSAIAPPVGVTVHVGSRRNTAIPTGQRIPRSPSVAAHPGGSPQSPLWTTSSLLGAAWLAGMIVFLLPAAAGLWQVLRLRRSGIPWPGGQTVAAKAGRRVDVLLCEELAGPIACGLGRPSILLPMDAPEWNGDDLNRAMVHELEHVSRRDWAIHCAARALCAVYWFHPLAWMAWRRLELEAERSCDDAVLERSEATAYAEQLITVAQRLSAVSQSPLPAMARRADLALRVNAVLDRAQRRGRAGAVCVTGAIAAAALLALTVAPLRVVAAPQSAEGVRLPSFQTETKLVLTQVKVLYPSGVAIEGLTAADFEITEDGVPQRIQICEFQKIENASDGLTGYYTLGYYASNSRDGKFRQIRVTVKTITSAIVDHRNGYYLKNLDIAVARTSGTGTTTERATPSPFDRPPVLIFKREPEYSEEARKAKYQGTVMLAVEIDESGNVANLRVVRRLGLGLDEKAIEAVQQWRFRPAVKDGKQVSVQTELEVIFRLL